MKELLSFLIAKIVDHPEEVEVSETFGDDGQLPQINFLVKVHPDDMGKIIGKNGKIIKAIRHLVRLPSLSQNRRVNVELVEPEASRAASQPNQPDTVS